LVGDIECSGGTVENAVVPPLCPVDVSPYDFTRAGELIDRAARSTREWLDGAFPINNESMHTIGSRHD
jgi:NTE family protein